MVSKHIRISQPVLSGNSSQGDIRISAGTPDFASLMPDIFKCEDKISNEIHRQCVKLGRFHRVILSSQPKNVPGELTGKNTMSSYKVTFWSERSACVAAEQSVHFFLFFFFISSFSPFHILFSQKGLF